MKIQPTGAIIPVKSGECINKLRPLTSYIITDVIGYVGSIPLSCFGTVSDINIAWNNANNRNMATISGHVPHIKSHFPEYDQISWSYYESQKQNGSTPNYQVLTSNLIHGKFAPFWQIFILQQINVEKNGFHSLTDWQIVLHTI